MTYLVPNYEAFLVFTFGDAEGALRWMAHAAIHRQETTRLSRLVAVEEPALDLVELLERSDRGVAIAPHSVLHRFTPDGVTIGP